jgi:tRNA(Ile)-lysidine synthase
MENEMDLLDVQRVSQILTGFKKPIVGVSGGVDSMVLLHWLATNKKAWPCEISVVHVNHNIQSDSLAWHEFVKSQCHEYNLPFIGVSVCLDGLGNNLEYAARKARYKAFCDTGADCILLAHHANDQCENFLLKLFRGSGLRGLKSMNAISPCWYNASVSIIRPMLNITRTDIEIYAEHHSVPFVLDSSNSDNKYDRNYIRNVVWPKIDERFGIADVNVLKSINHLDEAWQLTNQLAEIDLKKVTLSDGVLDWHSLQEIGYLRIKNLLLYLLSLENTYSFSIGQIEQFAAGLMSADLDNRNQLVVKGMTFNKIGRRVLIQKT